MCLFYLYVIFVFVFVSEIVCMIIIIVFCVYDIGGLQVCCVVFILQVCSVGLFVFVDQMGLAVFGVGIGIDVCLYLYIGLVIVIFLWFGVIGYCDMFGLDQVICFGDVNWMIVGCGIVYFECILLVECEYDYLLYGMQIWIVLFRSVEEIDLVFYYYVVVILFQQCCNGVWLCVIVGCVYGEELLVKVFSDIFNVVIDLNLDGEIDLDIGYVECLLYIFEGEVQLDGVDVLVQYLILFELGVCGCLCVKILVKVMLMGGELLDGLCYLWWNFVFSFKECLEQVKYDWEVGVFGIIFGDDKEFIFLLQV